MNEEPFFFEGEGVELFGVLHSPECPSHATAFVFCAPFGEEKMWAHRVYVSFARELCRSGHFVLRFDYRGTGDSDGDFEDGNLENYLADVRAALGVLKQRADGAAGFGLLGLRFGALVAAVAAERLAEVSRLILWAPISRGADYMQELLRVNLAMQMALYKEVRQGRNELVLAMRRGGTANVDGYEIAGSMYDQVSTVDLLVGEKRADLDCLVVQLAPRRPPVVGKEFELLASRYARGRTAVAAEDLFWKEIKPFYTHAPNVTAETLRWLEQVTHVA
jgi:exosortase A-associated hydrolase 2